MINKKVGKRILSNVLATTMLSTTLAPTVTTLLPITAYAEGTQAETGEQEESIITQVEEGEKIGIKFLNANETNTKYKVISEREFKIPEDKTVEDFVELKTENIVTSNGEYLEGWELQDPTKTKWTVEVSEGKHYVEVMLVTQVNHHKPLDGKLNTILADLKIATKSLTSIGNSLTELTKDLTGETAIKDYLTVAEFNNLRTKYSEAIALHKYRTDLLKLQNNLIDTETPKEGETPLYKNYTKENIESLINQISLKEVEYKVYKEDKDLVTPKTENAKTNLPVTIQEDAVEFLEGIVPTGYMRNQVNLHRTNKDTLGTSADKVIKDVETYLKTKITSESGKKIIDFVVTKTTENDKAYLAKYKDSKVTINNWWNLTSKDIPTLPDWIEGGTKPVEDIKKDYSKIDEVFEYDKAFLKEFEDGLGVKLGTSGTDVKIIKTFPKDGYIARITIVDSDTNDKLADTSTQGKDINLRNTKGVKNIKVGYQLYKYYDKNMGQKIGEGVKEFSLSDTKAPELQYAYVVDGALVLNVTDDNSLHSDTPILYRFKGETEFRKLSANFGYGEKVSGSNVSVNGDESNSNKGSSNLGNLFSPTNDKNGNVNFNKYERLTDNDYRIELKEIPIELQVVAMDQFENKTPISIKIEKDNTVLTKNAPKEIVDLLAKLDTQQYTSRKFDDVFTTTLDKTINIQKAFQKMIVNEFKSYNTFDLVVTDSEGKNINSENHKFEKAGIHKLTIKNKKSYGEVVVYVNVKEANRESISYKVLKELEITGNKLTAKELIKPAIENTLPPQLIAATSEGYFTLEEDIMLPEDEKEIKVRIIDLDTGEIHNITVTSKGLLDGIIDLEEFDEYFPQAGTNTIPPDVTGHWGEKHISKMIDKGLMYTFEDDGGSFEPNSMVSKREMLGVVGRIGAKVPNIANKAVEDLKDRNYSNTEGWGESAINFALNRLPKNIFEGQDLDQPITRDESAYLIANFFTIKDKGYMIDLKDMGSSNYLKEVKMLISTGAIHGTPEGNFLPLVEITRAEMAKILATLL